MTTQYEVQVLADFRELHRIRADWNRLAAVSQNVFTNFAWVNAWWSEIAQPSSAPLEWFALVVRRKEDIVAIAPLVRRTIRRAGASIRKLQFAAAPYADYQDFLLSDDPEGQITAIVDHLSSRYADWDILELLDIRCDSRLASLVLHSTKPPIFIRTRAGSVCPYVELRSGDRDLQRRIKRLMSAAARAGFQTQLLSPIEDKPGLLAGMMEVERSRAAQDGRKLLVAAYPAFIERLMDDFADCMYAILLLEGQQLVSYELGFRVQDSVWMYTRAFDSAYAKSSPGMTLQAAIVHWAVQNGYREYDFLRGDEPYKFRWTKQARRNHQLLIWHSALRSRAAAALFRSLPRWRNGNGR